jgi:hypothetical protein
METILKTLMQLPFYQKICLVGMAITLTLIMLVLGNMLATWLKPSYRKFNERHRKAKAINRFRDNPEEADMRDALLSFGVLVVLVIIYMAVPYGRESWG